jgi:hypothetical protein
MQQKQEITIDPFRPNLVDYESFYACSIGKREGNS